jgi:MYXO-CTERM domain-containing protein
MRFPKHSVVLAIAVLLALPSTRARAHWCDDLWSSGYDIVVRPDSDTSPKELYVENRWGYQLTNLKLTATTAGGATVNLTPPTTLTLPNTLLPGEKGTWKIASGSPAKIEDLVFDVRFGDTSGANSKQWACYPVLGASPVMVVKNDGSFFPDKIAGIDSPQSNQARGCSFGDVGLGGSLQFQTIADWEDENAGLDKLLQIYCSGRGSWGAVGPPGSPAGEDVSLSYCKNTSSTTCPTVKPTASPGSRTDYMHLWAAGALAIRKASLGARLPVLRERLKCGANDGDTGIGGFPLFVMGYLGDDPDAKSFLQTQASASGDIGTIAKAALYLMGDTSQKSAVQAGVKSSSVFAKVACAGALGIVDRDDASVESALIPEVKWNEPDLPSGDGGRAMFAAHILEIVAFNRRGWIFRGNAEGPVTFYGETGSLAGTGGKPGTGGTVGAGGASGTVGPGGTTGNRDAGRDVPAGNGGTVGEGGTTGAGGGAPGSGGSTGIGGTTSSGNPGTGGAEPQGSGGAAGSGGASSPGSGSDTTAGGSSGTGGSPLSSGGSGGSPTGQDATGQSSDCKCSLGGRPGVPAFWFPAVAGLALLLVRRRRHRPFSRRQGRSR